MSKLKKTYDVSKTAHKKANYNEQYSRKNNIKILNIPEAKEENEITLAKTVGQILKTHTEVDLQPIDIVALHRIPSKRGRFAPYL
ncbi:hypothetical protein DPMN_150384 [Dreissena polymorpha]|uniref:Uncharacterized protein n=1 Tax=Dreissena polymorpha TaxID=45954 RepID=A0A9D4FEI3_DREPO|nr:hypothetical protein DPMN_150384 [Dreissena polymorpha]